MNAQAVAAKVRALIAVHRPRVVALDMSRVPDIEYSALQVLLDTDRRATALGIEWWLVALNPGVLDVVRKAGLADRLGRERMLFNARAAIERYRKLELAKSTPNPPPEPVAARALPGGAA
jgi:MFS superfamily sulfate permease-like transporter